MHTSLFFAVGAALGLIVLAVVIQRRANRQRTAVRNNLAVAVARTDRGKHRGPRTDYNGQPVTFSRSDGDSNFYSTARAGSVSSAA